MRRLHRIARSQAFTIVELLIVIAVLVIAAAIVIPSIGSAADTQAISAARVLGSDLEVTRSLALTTQQPHSLVFSPDLQSYKVLANYSGGPYAAAVAIAHPVVAGKQFEVTLSRKNGMSAVRIVGPAFGGKALTYVTFNSQGEPSSGGTVTVESGQVEMQISVAALTGAVTVTRVSG